MKLSMTRRGFVLGSASAAVMAGLAACSTPGASSDAKKKSEAPKQLDNGDKNAYFKSDYEFTKDGEQKLVDDQRDLFMRTVHEGVVLLKNEAAALPLSTSEGKVTAFGNAGPMFVPGFDKAMTDAGFTFDDAAWKFYTDGGQNSNSYKVNENPWSDVESAGFLQSVGGTAIVFLGRVCHEGCDAHWYEDNDYLALSAEEKDMLSHVAQMRRDGTFSKMIVVMAMSNTVSWEDGEWSDAIDSILWFGSICLTNYSVVLPHGAEALVDLIDGKANPSGRMPDTFYKDNHANPVMANFGRIDADLSLLSDGLAESIERENDKWAPGNSIGNHWRRNYVYAEGIYIGYRYPETRYEDKVLGQGNAGDFDYASYVAYPFGHGLSYTTFAYSDLKVEEGADDFTVNVTVTNTGSVAGKTAVCAYVQSPYTDYDRANGIEKAAVELKGYEKTSELAPGASEQVAITVSRRELASYDANGAKTYVLDAGDYYFTVAGSAHEAMNNVLAAKGKTVADGMTAEGDASLAQVWSNPDFDAQTFAESVCGAQVTNLFDESDPNKNQMISSHNSVTWLSRSDWQGTFPKDATHITYTDELAELARPFAYAAGSGDAKSVPTHEFGKQGNKVMLVDMRGKDYDDADWDKIVSTLSYDDMVTYITDTQAALESIGKPKTVSRDGSLGWGGSSSDVYEASGLQVDQWPSKETVAATFSTEINEGIGKLCGEAMLHSSTMEVKNTSLLGWSCNAHRSPYSGRNLEYFSEDPYLGGRSCAEETRGVGEKGGLVYVKHVAGNDQEEFRHGSTTWMNEQTMREIYLRQFEKTAVEGKATGFMSGFNRLAMSWTGESHALLKDFLEGELGYRGTNITDNFEGAFMDAVDGLLNGTHSWLFAANYTKIGVCKDVLLQDDYKNDPVIQDALFEAVHRSLYNFANSLAMNGLTHDYAFEGDNPLATAYSEAALASTKFYGDKTFKVSKTKKPRARVKGTWELSDKGELTLTNEDGSAIEVTETDGMYSWNISVSGKDVPNQISRYDLVSAYNEYAGKKIDAGDQPTYKLSFAAGSDAVAGSAPEAMDIHFGDKVTLPECSCTGEHMVFGGWKIGSKTYKAGADYKVDSYADLEAAGVWTVKALATAETLDDYRFTYAQDDGIPMVLYADGTVKLQNYKNYSCSGTWQVGGSGSGAGTLTILNESGSPVALEEKDGKASYAQSGLISDWHQPDLGYGSGVLRANLVHTIDLAAFAKAHNEELGTNYDSISVASGSASFTEKETKKDAK